MATAAGASMVVEGAFAEAYQADMQLTPPRQQPNALAAMYAAAEARQSNINRLGGYEDSSLRAPSAGSPRRQQPSPGPLSFVPQRWQTQGNALAAPPTPVQRRLGQRLPLGMEWMENSTYMQPAPAVAVQRRGNASFRSAVTPPAMGFGPVSHPSWVPQARLPQDAMSSSEVPLARPMPPPIATASEVVAY